MNPLLILACVWVVAAAITAFLPLQRQYAPGLALLAAAPVLIGALAWHFGWWMGAIALAAFLSMFRRPLVHMARWLYRRILRA